MYYFQVVNLFWNSFKFAFVEFFSITLSVFRLFGRLSFKLDIFYSGNRSHCWIRENEKKDSLKLFSLDPKKISTWPLSNSFHINQCLLLIGKMSLLCADSYRDNTPVPDRMENRTSSPTMYWRIYIGESPVRAAVYRDLSWTR